LNKLCAGQEEIKNNARARQEELRKHVKDVRADVETEKSAIQDGIKNDDIAVEEDNEDLIENSTSTVGVGQEDRENRSLKLEAVKVTTDETAGGDDSAWWNAAYTTRASPGWTTGMLAVRETRSLPKGVREQAA
jgi:hypothetical protein